MRFRHVAVFGVLGAFACAAAAACIPELITDAAVADAGDAGHDSGPHCGDNVIDPPGDQCDPGSLLDGGPLSILGCNDCQVDCGDAGLLDPRTNHCYFVGDPATSLNDGENSAAQICQKFSAHVVTFADDTERKFVLDNFASVLKIGNATAFWVGLSLDPARAALVPVDIGDTKEPGWSPTCSGCYAAPNVDGSIPRLVSDAGGSCVLETNQTGWTQFPCSQIPTPIPVLCEREPVGDSWRQCNGGFCAQITETAASKRYLFSFVAASADQASSACADLGGSLAVFNSRQERETLLRALLFHYATLLASDPSLLVPNEAWIGYATTPDAGPSFTWDSDGGFAGSPWGDNQPSTDASLPARAYVDLNADDYDVQLAHDDTDVPRPYICQY